MELVKIESTYTINILRLLEDISAFGVKPEGTGFVEKGVPTYGMNDVLQRNPTVEIPFCDSKHKCVYL